jgi:hypothetical protein
MFKKKSKDRELVGGVEVRFFGKNGALLGKRQATKPPTSDQ